jgi:L-fuculose-phosphate aldolase
VTVDAAGIIEDLCAVGRSVVAAGLVVGSGGNLSARVPASDAFWITGAGTWLDRLTPQDFAEVRVDGDVTDPDAIAPSTEVALHVATYRVRPDVNAIVHLHPQVSILLDALGEPIRLVTTDHTYYLRRVGRVPFYPPGTADLADAAAAAVADGTNCVILAHHGCSVLAADIAMAHRRASNLEEAARLTYRALLLRGGLPDRHVPECPWDLPGDDHLI